MSTETTEFPGIPSFAPLKITFSCFSTIPKSKEIHLEVRCSQHSAIHWMCRHIYWNIIETWMSSSAVPPEYTLEILKVHTRGMSENLIKQSIEDDNWMWNLWNISLSRRHQYHPLFHFLFEFCFTPFWLSLTELQGSASLSLTATLNTLQQQRAKDNAAI